jgi:MFS family permease
MNNGDLKVDESISVHRARSPLSLSRLPQLLRGGEAGTVRRGPFRDFTWPVIWGILGIFILRSATGATGAALQLLLRRIGEGDGHVDASTVGLFGVAFYSAELVGSTVLGALSDRWGRKLFLILGAAIGMLAVQLTALTTVIVILLITRFLEGLSTASSAPASLGLLSAETAHSDAIRGRVMAVFEMATVIGLTAGIVIAGPLFQYLGNHTFWVVSAIYALAALVFWRVRSHRADSTRAKLSFGRYLEVLGQRRVLVFAPAWIAINAILGTWMGHAFYQLSGKVRQPDQFLMGGFSGTQISVIFLGFALSFIAGMYVWGLVYARYRRTSIMLFALGGIFAFAGLLFAINHSGGVILTVVPLVILGIVAIGIASGFTPASLGYLAEIAESSARDRGTVMGLYSVFLGGGQLIGTYVGGHFARDGGVDGLILLTFLLAILALFTVLLLRAGEVGVQVVLRSRTNE